MPRSDRSGRLSRIAEPRVVGLPLIATSFFIAIIDQTSAFLGTDPELTLRSLILGQSAVAVSFLIARLTWLRWGRGYASVMIATIFSGQILGQIVASSASLNRSDVYITGFDHVIFQSLALTFSAWLVASIQEHRDDVADLESRRIDLLTAKNLGKARLHSEREEVVRAVEHVLDTAVSDLEREPSEIATRLNRASEDALRPLSHELVERREPFKVPSFSRPRIRWLASLSNVVATPLIAPRTIAFFMTFLVMRSTFKSPSEAAEATGQQIGGAGLQATVELASLGRAFILLSSVFVATYLSALVVRRSISPLLAVASTGGRWVIGIFGILSVSLMTQLLVILAEGVFSLRDSATELSIAEPIWFIPVALVAITMGIVRGLEEVHGDLTRQLQEINSDLMWETARINEELLASRRYLSQVIHGPIRAALMASAMEVTMAQRRGEPVIGLIPTLTERISQARKRIHEPVVALDLLKEASGLKSLWSGVCEIAFDIPPQVIDAIVADPISASAIHAVIEESIANAIFHASAKRVDVRIDHDGHVIAILIENDGNAPSTDGERGLGSRLLDEVTTEWTIESDDGRTRLRAVVPFERSTV